MKGQMIPYPHLSGLRCHVSNRNSCQGCVLEFGGIYNVLLDYSGRVEGKVEVLDQSAATASS